MRIPLSLSPLIFIALAGCAAPPTSPAASLRGAGVGAEPRAHQVLSAEESDPRALGWMEGFPPPPDKRIGQPDADSFSFPKLRWSVCHLREFLPTEQVSRGLGAPVPLEYELDESGKHAAMSMTKSLTGLLAEILVSEGRLDYGALVREIVPELAESAFGDATVRQVMDMTTALAFSEDYSDPRAEIWTYSAAASPLPKPAGYTGPDGYYEYLATVRAEGAHGEAFGYKTVNTDVLGWVVSRVSGKAVTELLSDRIWSRMGAEQDAYFTVDGRGTPFAGGGMSAGLRDLGRIGLLMLGEGELHGERLFPAEVARTIQRGGDRAAFAKAGYTTLPGGSYRSMWWVIHDDHGAYAARGVHGQTIYVDPAADMVIVRFASFPDAFNSKIDPTSLPAYRAVSEYLSSK